MITVDMKISEKIKRIVFAHSNSSNWKLETNSYSRKVTGIYWRQALTQWAQGTKKIQGKKWPYLSHSLQNQTEI